MVEDKKAPEIRFDGFSGDWESKLLGDVLEIWSASRVHKDEWTNEGVPFFRSSDVVSAFVGKENVKAYISNELYNNLSAISGKVIKDDVLVTGGGSIAIPYLVANDNPLYFKDGDLLLLRDSTRLKVSGRFLYCFFTSPSLRKYVASITHIGTISHYTIEQIKATPVSLPKIEEQTAISSFFRSLDDTITLKKQQHEKTVNIKKAMLEKMFPKNGADVPEIRYDGFTEPWEHRQLSSISDTTYGGGTPSTSKEDYWNGNIPWIQSADVKENNVMSIFIRKKITSKGLENSAAKLIPANSIAVVTRVGVGKLCAIPFEYATSQDILSLSRLNIDVKFGAYAIYSKFQAELNAVQGTSIKGVTKDELLRKSIYVPVSSNEQTAIGNFFRNLDTLIEAQREEIEKLRNIKKACLNKMFV